MSDQPTERGLRRRLMAWGIGVAFAAGMLDQFSKWWILHSVMQPPRVIDVTPFFNLVLAWNRGVSFGMFNTHSDNGPLILSAIAGVIVIGMLIWLWRAETRWTAIALGLIIGGAIGNVIDRLNYGAVVDFLDVHVMGYHWPAFNVADSAICVGAGMIILESLFAGRETS